MSTQPAEVDVVGRTAPRAAHDVDFDSWVALASPRLRRLARLVGHDEHASADAVQDALLAVLARWRRLSEPGAADAYARRVVVNRRISWWRRIGRREHLMAGPPEPVGTEQQPNPDAVLARRLLHDLPPRQRAAVVLRYFDDLSFAEIADTLGCPESTARSYVHRALARLRTQLEEQP